MSLPPSVRPGATIDVTATDAHGVNLLVFVLDDPTGTPLKELTAPPETALTPPFQVTLPSTTSEGPHTLFVIAEDTRKNCKVYSSPFAADSTPPTLTITDKSAVFAGERSPMRVFGFHAFDDKGISKARVLVDGVDTAYPSEFLRKVLTPSPFNASTSSLKSPTRTS